MKLISIASVLLLLQLVRCQLELGNCRLQCDGASQNIENLPKSCDDFDRYSGVRSSCGVYTIYPYGNLTGLRVFCDFETDGGNWLVIQKRVDGSEDFDRNFIDYVNGFGRLEGEFWLGLEAIHALTKQGKFELRFDMEDFDNETRYAVYSGFSVGPGTDYALSFGSYSGTAGDSLGGHLGQGTKFSTKDRDQDNWNENCAATYRGAFWFNVCHFANPNGLYLGGPHESFADGIEWYTWRGHRYSLKRIEMKIRRAY